MRVHMEIISQCQPGAPSSAIPEIRTDPHCIYVRSGSRFEYGEQSVASADGSVVEIVNEAPVNVGIERVFEGERFQDFEELTRCHNEDADDCSNIIVRVGRSPMT